MSAIDLDALSAHFVSVFDGFAHGVHDESTMNNVTKLICNTVLSALSGRLTEWNESNAKYRLPPELFALSVQHLSFLEKFNVSHVSRSWRAAMSPSLWAHIDLPNVRGASKLLETALVRAGTVPVDLKFSSFNPVHSVESVMSQHMHRFRSIDWLAALGDPDTIWTQPAPFLEHLSCATRFRIPRNFLGGQPGRLTTLEFEMVSLPAEAPALGTVTTFSGNVVPDSSSLLPDGISTAHIFKLFPRLESLELLNFRAEDIVLSGRAPPSLTELTIESWFEACDGIPLYLALRTGRLSRVVISGRALEGDITPLLTDVRHLALNSFVDATRYSLVAVDARGHSRTLFLPATIPSDRRPPPLHLVDTILHVAPALRHLESLQMSPAQFCYLTKHPHYPQLLLSELKVLTLHIHEQVPRQTPRRLRGVSATAEAMDAIRTRSFPWQELESLFHPQDMKLELHSFVLEVRCIDNARSPTRADVLDLFGHLGSAVQGGFTSVCIRGFPAAAIHDIDTNSVPGLHITFEKGALMICDQ